MTDFILPAVLLLPFWGALVAGLYGWTERSDRLRLPIGITGLTWGLAFFPLAAFAGLFVAASSIEGSESVSWQVPWAPTLGLQVGLYLDGLSALFGLIITGIGVLVVVYSGYYFQGDRSAWRFLCYLFLFMAAMLGLVLAGDIVTLFVFWEVTSITSFLLVAYKTNDEAARRGAFKALFITGGGGIALLVGLLLVSTIAGGSDWASIVGAGDTLRASALYPVMLGLVAFGAFTKSAQFPAHIWLPDAMSAPTPASAFLHSATMVKAGVYLMARLNPALGETGAWFWLLSIVGLTTMVAGAYLGLKQVDLKALLAYSTISQIGVLIALIGQDTAIAFKALAIAVLAHALYKSALFMVAGIVDHETGTRDLRRLGGLARPMPATFVIATIAGLSMAGLPPLFGFLAKETLLATVTHPGIPDALAVLFPAAAVAAGALILAQAGLFIWDTFLGRPRTANLHAHEAPRGMLLAPAIPALLSLAVSVLPEPYRLANLLAAAATDAYGSDVKVSLSLWTGINVPLLLSAVAISLGAILFLARDPVRAWQQRTLSWLSFDAVYDGVLRLIEQAAKAATRLQTGSLHFYLLVILTGTGVLLVLFGALMAPPWSPALSLPSLTTPAPLALLRVFALLFAATAAVATVVLRRGFYAVLAITVSGLGIALLMVLEPAPDVALVQVVVDFLATVILVLLLSRLPGRQLHRAWRRVFGLSRGSLARDLLVAGSAGLVLASLSWIALTSRPRESIVTPYYAANAKTLTGAKDIVGAIVVDFRLFDTVVEIAVFSVAGLAVYTLLRYALQHDPSGRRPLRIAPSHVHSLGIGGYPTSALVHALANVSLPLALVLAFTHMMYGHDQPGDGFTAGVIIGLAVGFWYVVFGYHETKRRLPWLRPTGLIGGGLLLALGNGALTALLIGTAAAPYDYGAEIGLPLPVGFAVTSSFFSEVAICLAVLGSVILILDTLGHPTDAEAEVERDLAAMTALQSLEDRGLETPAGN